MCARSLSLSLSLYRERVRAETETLIEVLVEDESACITVPVDAPVLLPQSHE